MRPSIGFVSFVPDTRGPRLLPAGGLYPIPFFARAVGIFALGALLWTGAAHANATFESVGEVDKTLSSLADSVKSKGEEVESASTREDKEKAAEDFEKLAKNFAEAAKAMDRLRDVLGQAGAAAGEALKGSAQGMQEVWDAANDQLRAGVAPENASTPGPAETLPMPTELYDPYGTARQGDSTRIDCPPRFPVAANGRYSTRARSTRPAIPSTRTKTPMGAPAR